MFPVRSDFFLTHLRRPRGHLTSSPPAQLMTGPRLGIEAGQSLVLGGFQGKVQGLTSGQVPGVGQGTCSLRDPLMVEMPLLPNLLRG